MSGGDCPAVYLHCRLGCNQCASGHPGNKTLGWNSQERWLHFHSLEAVGKKKTKLGDEVFSISLFIPPMV